jgi:hypothetical protein
MARAAFGHANGCRQILRHGIGEGQWLPLDGVGQQQRGEHLRDGADFEHRVAIKRSGVAAREASVRHDSRPAGSMTPTTIPTLWRLVSTRSTKIFWISVLLSTPEFVGVWADAELIVSVTNPAKKREPFIRMLTLLNRVSIVRGRP